MFDIFDIFDISFLTFETLSRYSIDKIELNIADSLFTLYNYETNHNISQASFVIHFYKVKEYHLQTMIHP